MSASRTVDSAAPVKPVTSSVTRPDNAAPVAGDAHPVDQPSGALSALRNPSFARYWSTLALSLTGTWVRITAMGYLVYDLTGDPFKLGLISFAQAAPELVAGPIAGAYMDRADRRKILLAVQAIYIAMMLLVTALIVTGTVAFWHLLVIAVIIGTAVGFDWPARLSLVPLLIARKDLQSAVALNAAAFNGSRIIGPSIAGWLIGGIGLAFAFGTTMLAALPYAIALLTLSVLRPAERPAHTTSPFTDLIAGYRYIWRTPTIRGLLSVDIVPVALGMSYFTMAPAIASDVLGLGSTGLGMLLAANGVGSLTGTLLVALLSNARHRGRIVITGIALFGLIMLVFSFSNSVWLSFPAILGLGLVWAIYATFNDTLIQTNVDDTYRGRVLAVYSMLWGLTPVGGLLAGWLADLFGLQWALGINALLVLAYVPVLWFLTPVRNVS